MVIGLVRRNLRHRIFSNKVVFGVLVSMALTVVNAPSAGADTISGKNWIASQQQNDGGFEVSGFAGFETPDASLALAQAANNDSVSWDECRARNTLLVQRRNSANPLHYLDDFVDSSGASLSSAKAGEIATLASAIGYDAHNFNPDGDSSTDLLAIIDADANSDGSYGPAGSFASTLWAVLSKVSNNESLDPSTTAYILSTQQDNGGFNYAGDATQTGTDIDTTGRTLLALKALGVAKTESHIEKALAFLAGNQQGDGGFIGDYQTESNASSTSMVVLGMKAYGVDLSVSTWRDLSDPSLLGNPYTSPLNFINSKQNSDGHFNSEYDAYGTNTITSSQSIQAITGNFFAGTTPTSIKNCPPPVEVLGEEISNTAYNFFYANGNVVKCLSNSPCSIISTVARLNAPIVAGALTPSGNGGWGFAADGGVFSFGDANFYGSAAQLPLNKPIVDAEPTADGGGYALFAEDGGVFAFGNASFAGSAANQPHAKIVGGALVPNAPGYWLFEDNGGVLTFGNASFAGSASDIDLQGRIVDGEATSSGAGYVMFGSDGGVFTFGSANFYGSMASARISGPVMRGSMTPSGNGYEMLARDGGVFNFGDSAFLTAMRSSPNGLVDLAIG